MNLRQCLLLATAVVFIGGVPTRSSSQDGKDPDVVLKEIQTWYSEELSKARQANPQGNLLEILNQRTAKIKEAAKQFEVGKTDAAKCLSLAQLFQQAAMYKEAADAGEKYLGTSPADAQKYTTQSLLLTSYGQLGRADDVVRLVAEMKPSTNATAAMLARSVAGLHASNIAKVKGVEAGLKLIDDAFAKVDVKALKEEDAKRAEAAKAETDPSKARVLLIQGAQADTLIATVYQAKSSLYDQAGKSKEALALLEEGIKALPAGSSAGRSMQAKLTQSRLVGSAAMPIKKDRAYGEFESLEALRGKVVLVDFMAHWCGPCKRSYPLTRKMYDELKPKGLEVVSVTRFYGYYGQERNIDQDKEWTKLKEHNDEHAINWPVVVGPGANSEQYGVTGIPTYIVIDRAGKVKSIKVGFSEPYFAELRKTVEAALAEPAAQK